LSKHVGQTWQNMLAKLVQTCWLNMTKHVNQTWREHGCWPTCLDFENFQPSYANLVMLTVYGIHSSDREHFFSVRLLKK
jgi:hypothetical protein